MILSHTHRFIYLKTRKTAGTSVEDALMAHLGVSLERNKATVTDTVIVGARGSLARAQGWYNHMPWDDVAARAPDAWRDYFKFCCVRNPWDKVVSYFHHKNRHLKFASLEETVANFRRYMRQDRLYVGRDTEIYFDGDRPVVDHVLRHSHIQADFDAVCARFGFPPMPLPSLKSTSRDQDNRIPYQNYYNKFSKDLVADMFATEIHHYGWDFDTGLSPRLAD
ncbi:MAG: sulfotransferase family 2 domain-containing protein [Pseudomonadota bacterium]